jgi:hypothetical protein
VFENEFTDNHDPLLLAESKVTEEMFAEDFNASFEVTDSNINNQSKYGDEREKERLRIKQLKEKRRVTKLKKANEFKEFLEKSGVSVVFQSIFNEVLGKNVSEEDVYKYTASRLREIGKSLQDIDAKYE